MPASIEALYQASCLLVLSSEAGPGIPLGLLFKFGQAEAAAADETGPRMVRV